MNGKVTMTITGNLVAEPELKFTPNGNAVANFTVASTPRVYSQQSGKWEDGQALFMRVRVWRDQAENIAESRLSKGTRITVTGILTQRSWEDENKQRHTIYELDADEVAASMKFAQVAVKRITRTAGEPGGNGSSPKADAGAGQGQTPPPF
ncbi:single-stranded DNA-binding protein [Mycobacterium sp. NPDC003323]